MPTAPFRVVLDTNILVRGLINSASDSGQILKACEDRQVVALLSKPLLSEYFFILSDPALVERYPILEAAKIKTAIERLTYVGDLLRAIRVRFPFPRDPKDEKLICLAIAGRATHLITTDRDLLDLSAGRDVSANRFRQRLPGLAILTPDQFVERYGRLLRIERHR